MGPNREPGAHDDQRRATPRADHTRLADILVFLATLNLLSVLTAGGLSIPIAGLRVGSPPLSWSIAILLATAGYRFAWPRMKAENIEPVWTRIVEQRFLVGLALLTLIGLILRITNIDFGMPLITHPDEPTVAGIAVEMLRSGWIDPKWYIYPTFFMNLMLPGFALYYVYARGHGYIGPLEELRSTTPGFYIVGRYYSAIMGTATILLTYGLARRLLPAKGRRVGLIAAAIVAFSFIHVRESHFAVTDVPMTMMTTAALIAIANLFHVGRPRDYVAAGLLCGLAASTKYTAAPVVVALGAAHLLARRPGEWLSRSLAMGLAAIPAGFLLGSPYALLNWGPFLEHLSWVGGFAGDAAADQARAKLVYIFGYSAESGFGLVVLGLFVAALLRAIYQRRREELVLVIFIVTTIALLSQSTHRFFPRFLLPLLPPIAILVGNLVSDAIRWVEDRELLKPRPSAAVVLVVIAVLVWPTANESIVWIRTQGRQDTRAEAYLWIRDRFPGGAVIASEIRLVGMPREYRLLDNWGVPFQQFDVGKVDRDSVDVVILAASEDTRAQGEQAGLRSELKAALGPPRSFEGQPANRRPGPTFEVYVVTR